MQPINGVDSQYLLFFLLVVQSYIRSRCHTVIKISFKLLRSIALPMIQKGKQPEHEWLHKGTAQSFLELISDNV